MTPALDEPLPEQEAPPMPSTISPLWRAVLLVIGTISLALGVVGIVLPLLPTTPFLLVTAACYARASTRLYGWLLGQRLLGPIIAEWRRSRSLPPGVKTRALLAVVVTFALSIILVDVLVVRLILVVAGIMLAAFLTRMPTAQPAPASVTMEPTTPTEEPR